MILYGKKDNYLSKPSSMSITQMYDFVERDTGRIVYHAITKEINVRVIFNIDHVYRSRTIYSNIAAVEINIATAHNISTWNK